MRSAIFFVLILLGCSTTERDAKNKHHKKPNIILIMADDLGWGDVGFNGQDKIQTPNIDFLAKNGLIFNRMYAGSTVCGPSRASLITGFHTGHGEVRGNPRWSLSGKPVDFDPDHNTIAEILKRANYKTGIIGKWGLSENLMKTTPNKQGFDYFYGFNKHLPAHHYYPEQIWENDSLLSLTQNNTMKKQGDHVQELFTQKALDFLENNSDSPFFLYLPYTTPHFELTIAEEYKKPYNTLDWPLRKITLGHYRHDENGHVTYAAMMSKMDADIGLLIQKLKEVGQFENTLILFTSDNGHEYDDIEQEFFNSNGIYRGMKRDLYDGGLHVPFVAFWPEQIEPEQTTEHISAFWDMKATFAELAGVELQEATDGISFLPTLLGEEQLEQHDFLYWEFNEVQGPIQAVLKDSWKLLYFKVSSVYELYNLKEDPSESNNLIATQPLIFSQLKEKMANARTTHDQFPLTKRPNPWKK